MSESEFDAYLSLLGKLLNLSAKQRAHISDELRDHLEERFHALLDQGTPRDEALRAAVEELGDAAALAQQFTLPYHIRRRRQLMRYSLGSAVVIATTFVMAAFYWPANRPEPALQLQAQDAPRTTDVGSPHARKPSDLVSAQASKTASIRDDLTAKLEFRDFELKLDDVPWPEAIQFLSDVSDVDVLVDRRYVEESGVAMETPVQLKARPGALSVRSAMELILEQVAGMQLAYAVRDGVILISSPDNAYENRVYDCRDLLEGVVVHQPGGVVGGGGGFGGGGGGFGGGGAGG
ncbi:MAG: permease prefix domain 1-containing protein, partial [Planctomycetaceae bacterium]|nr:permease prefix domain 1-containing protein [Planctomycetaceae bacterium]